jgi:hypothetical protein
MERRTPIDNRAVTLFNVTVHVINHVRAFRRERLVRVDERFNDFIVLFIARWELYLVEEVEQLPQSAKRIGRLHGPPLWETIA